MTKVARISGKNIVLQHKFVNKLFNLCLEINEYYKYGWVDIDVNMDSNSRKPETKVESIESKFIFNGEDICGWKLNDMSSQEIKVYNYYYLNKLGSRGIVNNQAELDKISSEIGLGKWNGIQFNSLWDIGLVDETNGWKRLKWYIHFINKKPYRELN